MDDGGVTITLHPKVQRHSIVIILYFLNRGLSRISRIARSKSLVYQCSYSKTSRLCLITDESL